ncbi:tRNA epoxyqueuosine(34) reductase QueG [Planctomicrobium sp. SH668]|uniref:tRNA epoxyqueuosine(34) reductase QueG n=1 Tax=Planctomicrobium sp. SH668 TaxID=3448126 RepID=UPI003F5B7339
MPSPVPTPEELSRHVKAAALELGFELVGIAPAVQPETFGYFQDWVRHGLHASMDYIPRREQAYEHPEGVQVGARNVIVCAMNYGAGVQRSDATSKVAAYAQGTEDYHNVLRGKLGELASALRRLNPQARTRIAVDTAPILERDFARRAGLGWFGKNTMLINKWRGSYFFLGAILTDCELVPDAPHTTDHCGTCTRCLDACPTDAFNGPHVLDAGKCISYLTIELRDKLPPRELRNGVGEWLFGCDVCQQVCPWNRKASEPSEPSFVPRETSFPTAEELITISDDEFLRRFEKTPLARPGRIGMAKNAAIVLGNRGKIESAEILAQGLRDPSPLVRVACAWSLGELADDSAQNFLQRALETEAEESVLTEISTSIEKIFAKTNLERVAGLTPPEL